VGQWAQGGSGAFGDWTPLLLVLVSMVLIRFVVRLSMTWPTAFLAFVAGTVWGSLAERWGILRPTALALLLVLLASWTIDRYRHVPS
jgi:hypothetical protein